MNKEKVFKGGSQIVAEVVGRSGRKPDPKDALNISQIFKQYGI